jgi:hypothetical protein
MNQVRPFTKADFSRVAILHHQVMSASKTPSVSQIRMQDYADYFEKIYFQHPGYDESFPSLVYQEPDGHISGFLGVRSQRMLFAGKSIHVATSSQFAVEPSSRSKGAGVQLLKTFLSGPQELSLTDGGNNISRKLWEGLKGTTALLYSTQWKKLLRPALYGLSELRDRKLWSPLAGALEPFSNLTDALARRRLPHHFSFTEPSTSAETLTAESLLKLFNDSPHLSALTPQYDEHSMQWMLETVNSKQGWGTLRKHLIRDDKGVVLGGYIYYFQPKGTCLVLMLQANKRGGDKVLNHLFYDAWQRGASAITGRLEPSLMQELAERHCFFHCGHQWMLIHSYNDKLLQAIHRGDARLSMLEGEWCMRFPKPEKP